jgi:hypothetical protein
MHLIMLNLVRIISTRSTVEAWPRLNAWFVKFLMVKLLTTPILVEDRIRAEE